MPRTPYNFRHSPLQMEACRKLRELLGLSQACLVKESEKFRLRITRSTIQRCEGSGDGWIKPRTHLDLIEFFRMYIRHSRLDSANNAVCLALLESLKGNTVFTHKNAVNFIQEIETPSIISLTHVRSANDISNWWNSISDPPTVMDNTEIEARCSFIESFDDNYDLDRKNELIKCGLRHNTKITITHEDIKYVKKTFDACSDWVNSWDLPNEDQQMLEKFGNEVKRLEKNKIYTTIGLALASSPCIPIETPWPPFDNIVRKFRIAIAFGVLPIKFFQIWWQEEPKPLFKESISIK